MLLPKIIFPAFVFHADTCELTHCQCEGLSQALSRSVSPRSCFCLFLHSYNGLSEAFPQAHSWRLEGMRIYPQDSEAAFRQGKDKTPLFEGDFGRLDHFIPKRIKSVS